MFVSSGKTYHSREDFERQRQLGKSAEPEHLPFELRAQDLERALERPHETISLQARLRQRLGLGDDPERRCRLYAKLQALWEVETEKVEQAVAEVWAVARTSAKKPDRYFCVAIMKRLAELGVRSPILGVQLGEI